MHIYIALLWLDKEVADITVPATNDTTDPHHLQSVTSSEVPELIRAEVFVSGPSPPVQTFIQLIQRWNAGLHTDSWLLQHLQQRDQSMRMIWNIDKESADALEAIDNRPHFMLGRVTFKVSRHPDPTSPLKPQIGQPISVHTDLKHKRRYQQQQEV